MRYYCIFWSAYSISEKNPTLVITLWGISVKIFQFIIFQEKHSVFTTSQSHTNLIGGPYSGRLLMGCEWEYPSCRITCASCCPVLNLSASSVNLAHFSKMPVPEVANKFITLTLAHPVVMNFFSSPCTNDSY